MSIFNSETIPYTAVNNNKVYFCKIRKYFILDNYVHSSLPLVGWFKMCSNCSTITGDYELFEYSSNIFICIPICYHCFEKLTDNILNKIYYRETDDILFDMKSLEIFYKFYNFYSSLEYSSPSLSSSESL